MSDIKIEDLAELMGKTRREVEEMLRNDDVIELKLTERKGRMETREDFRVME